MKEENGKILLQPSFTKQQQQQTQHITTKLNNNNMTNKHEQQDKHGHQQWPDYKNQPLFQDFNKDNKPRRRRRRATSTFLNIPSNLKKK